MDKYSKKELKALLKVYKLVKHELNSHEIGKPGNMYYNPSSMAICSTLKRLSNMVPPKINHYERELGLQFIIDNRPKVGHNHYSNRSYRPFASSGQFFWDNDSNGLNARKKYVGYIIQKLENLLNDENKTKVSKIQKFISTIHKSWTNLFKKL